MEVIFDNPTADQVRAVLQSTANATSIFISLVERKKYSTAEMMLNNGFDINASYSTKTPLEYFVQLSNIAAVRFILPYGPNVNVESYGICYLASAFVQSYQPMNAENGKIVAQLLLDAGADINYVNSRGQNILQVIFGIEEIKFHSKFMEEALRFFVERGLDPVTLLDNGIARLSLYDLRMFGRIGLKLNEEQQMRIFDQWWPWHFIKYIVLICPTASDQIVSFIGDQVRATYIKYSKLNEYIDLKAYTDKLIEANCVRFIPDMDLYPPDKHEMINVLIASNRYSNISYLPIELIFEILSRV